MKAPAYISGFYATPPKVINMMIDEARPFNATDRVLEPSAGRGDIADSLRLEGVNPFVVEPHPELAAILRQKGYSVFEDKFENLTGEAFYDKIIMNPPFADMLDFAHIRHAYSLLSPGGTLVSLLTDGDDDATPADRAAFTEWAFCTAWVLHLQKIPLHYFQGEDVFRPSVIPKRMLTIRKPSYGK